MAFSLCSNAPLKTPPLSSPGTHRAPFPVIVLIKTDVTITQYAAIPKMDVDVRPYWKLYAAF